MPYTTKTKIENYLAVDIDSSFNSQLDEWILAADSYIDKYTGKSFGSVSEVRYFDGDNSRDLMIDEFISITKVEILAYESGDVDFELTEGQDEDFVTYPYNTTPKRRLILTPQAICGGFLKGKKRVKVTAVWGNGSSVPADITLASTMLVASVVQQGMQGGTLASESLGDYSVTFDTSADDSVGISSVKQILDRYKVYEL